MVIMNSLNVGEYAQPCLHPITFYSTSQKYCHIKIKVSEGILISISGWEGKETKKAFNFAEVVNLFFIWIVYILFYLSHISYFNVSSYSQI